MPEFQLNDNAKRRHLYKSLDTFTKGYVAAMFFTNGDTGDEREHYLNELGTERLTRDAVVSIINDCEKFLASLGPDARTMREWLDEANYDYDDEQAGCDLWFTRQGHGVGFWSREQLPEVYRSVLSAAAKALGEANVEVYQGWIRHR